MIRSLVLLMAVLGLSGCAAFNSATVRNERHTTIGQELIDLKKALDSGALTPNEYEVQKARILQESTPPAGKLRTIENASVYYQ